MTIAEYEKTIREQDRVKNIEGCGDYSEAMKHIKHVWSNEACRGYCKAALRELGKSPEEIREVMNTFTILFAHYTIPEAEQIYNET